MSRLARAALAALTVLALAVYGTSEVPGGIVFNATPDELDGVEILPLP